MPYIVIRGNPVDGFVHIGPFTDFDAAHLFVATERSPDNWWIVELDTPSEYCAQD